jgi:hypothetical protein
MTAAAAAASASPAGRLCYAAGKDGFKEQGKCVSDNMTAATAAAAAAASAKPAGRLCCAARKDGLKEQGERQIQRSAAARLEASTGVYGVTCYVMLCHVLSCNKPCTPDTATRCGPP